MSISALPRTDGLAFKLCAFLWETDDGVTIGCLSYLNTECQRNF